MASLFKPEIREIGGTNISVYQPPSVDYSNVIAGVGSALFESLTPPKPEKMSETEQKNQFLAPYLQRQEEILSSDIPDVKKSVLVKELEKEVAKNNAAYLDTFQKASQSITSYYDPSGDQIGKYYEQLNKWANSDDPIGQSARVNALAKATDKEGNVDDSIFMSELSASFNYDIARKEQLSVMNRNIETNKATTEFTFTTQFAPMAVDIVQKDIETFTSKPMIQTVLNKIMGGSALSIGESGTASYLSGLIKQQKEAMKAKLQREQVLGGINPNDSKFSVEPLLAPYTDLENALTNASTAVTKAIETSENQKNAIFLQTAPETFQQLKAAGNLPPAIADRVAINLVTAQGETKVIQELADALKVPTYTLNLDISGSGMTNTIGTIPNQSMNGTSETERLLPEWNNTLITQVAGFTPAQQEAQLKIANIQLKGYVSGTIDNAQNADQMGKELSTAYGILSTYAVGNIKTGVTPLDQTKLFFGPSAFNMVSDIQKKSPKSGESLYLQMNKTIQAEAIRHREYIGSYLSSAFSNNPFSLVINDRGVVEIKVNPEARKDPFLIAATAPIKEDETKIPDYMSDDEIFDKAFGMYNKLVGRTADVRKSIEALNLLLKASERLPENIKKSPDFAGIQLREQLILLPQYQGMTVNGNGSPE
jgi:hypothetical protein